MATEIQQISDFRSAIAAVEEHISANDLGGLDLLFFAADDDEIETSLAVVMLHAAFRVRDRLGYWTIFADSTCQRIAAEGGDPAREMRGLVFPAPPATQGEQQSDER